MNRFISVICSLLFSSIVFASSDIVVIDDFNAKKVQLNSLKKETGAWSTETRESGKVCKMSFGRDSKENPDGASLRIEYDIRRDFREKIPMCGYWTRIGLNLSSYKFLKMRIRGDTDFGFPRLLTVELKDKNYKTGNYTIEGITGKWQDFTVPLAVFKSVQDWNNILELGLVFTESLQCSRGALYIDDIAFCGESVEESQVGPFISVFAENPANLEGVSSGPGRNKRKSAPAVIDGKSNLEYGEVKSKDDLSAEIYSQWNNEYLYFLADIRDNEMVAVEESYQAQEGDGLTVLFDTNNDGFLSGGKDDIAVLLMPNGKAKILDTWREPAEDEARFTVNPSRGRYAILAVFSWKFLGVKPEKNKELAVSFAVQDLDITPVTKKGRINWVYKPGSGSVQLGRMILK